MIGELTGNLGTHLLDGNRLYMAKQHTIDDIPNSFQPCTTHRPFIDIQAGCLFVQPEEQHVTPNIKYRVDAGGKQRQ